jgi:hypothetical protein
MNYYFALTEKDLLLHERILDIPNFIGKLFWDIKIPKEGTGIRFYVPYC